MTDIYEANGCKFYAQDDMIIRWERKYNRKFEQVTTEWLWSHLDGTFVDVGAATGWFLIPAAKRGFKAVGFDPNQAVFNRLQQNIELNGVDAEVHNVAVSARSGKTTFWYNPKVPLTSGGSIEIATCHAPRQYEVDTVTLDDMVTEASVVKIDVEGHEMSVLSGAKNLIANSRPALILEANTEAHKKSLVHWMEKNEYVYSEADERNLLCLPI
ncbi:MAG TPA: FkbM family methyltransferase [Candidatus Obscuribacterales bacterium]